MHHSDEQVSRLWYRDSKRNTPPLNTFLYDLITHRQQPAALSHTFFRGDKPWDRSLKNELIQLWVLLGKRHVVFQSGSRTCPERIGALIKTAHPFRIEANT